MTTTIEESELAAPGTQRSLPLLLLRFVRALVVNALCALLLVVGSFAQKPQQTPAEPPRKVDVKPAETPANRPEPFDGASIEKMSGQCVTLETEAGVIVIEMLPKAAPESARSFLNLAGTGALDTTTFSRVVKNFIIQAGNLSTGEKWSAELSQRMSRKLPDEPNDVKHVRGIVSMARGDEPNTATTHFFILVGDGPHLDGKFAAFGRVAHGIEVAEAINHAPAEAERPANPVRIKRAVVIPCQN
jgi:peptidyl-prolyl cis-trans isomerase B (cyclophilin B)